MSGLLIDSDVLTDYLAGREQAADFIEYARDLHLSAVTIAEIGGAVRSAAEWSAIEAAFTALTIHPVDAAIARAASSLRGKTLAHRLITATAKVHGLTLVTRDKKAYPDLTDVLVPYRALL